MTAICKIRSFAASREPDAAVIRDGLTHGDARELLQEIDRMRGERVGILALQGELSEHMSMVVGYLEHEASQGDGIAEEHFDGYTAAKELLKRASARAQQWEDAQFELEELRDETRESCARICDERAKRHDASSWRSIEAESCAAAIRAGGKS